MRISKAPVDQIKLPGQLCRGGRPSLHSAFSSAIKQEIYIHLLQQDLWNEKVYQSDKREGNRDRTVARLPLEEHIPTLRTWVTADDAPAQDKHQTQTQSNGLPPLPAGSHSSGTEHTSAFLSSGLLPFTTAPVMGHGAPQAQNKPSSPRTGSQTGTTKPCTASESEITEITPASVCLPVHLFFQCHG